MWSEIATLFWLQWKLTLSMFRSRRTSDRLHVLTLLSQVLMFAFSVPVSLLAGAGVAVGLVLLSPQAAYEAAMLVNAAAFMIWLVLPASYNSQLVERFEMSRLYVHPVRFSSMVLGSALISLLKMDSFWTIPLLMGEVVGLAWHQPAALPFLVLGAVPAFAMLALSGRLMDDLFDLVANDRRLRALMISLLSLPFVLCWIGQYAFQLSMNDWRHLPPVVRTLFLEGFRSLSQADSATEFLETLHASRLLAWLPPGWATAGMGLTVTEGVMDAWARQLLFMFLTMGFVAVLLGIHAAMVQRLMQGGALSIGAARVRAHTWRTLRSRSAILWALLHKDWICLWRGPVPRRLFFSSLMSMLAYATPLWIRSPSRLSEVPALILGALGVVMIGMITNMGMTANYFGAIDQEGFGTLALSPLDRRQILLSANLATSFFAIIQQFMLLAVVALWTQSWVVLPAGLYLGLCIQAGGSPAYNLAAIIGPYRSQMRTSGGRRRGNLWGMLAWLVSVLPVLALVVPPYLLWRPGLLLTLPLCGAYSLGFYALTLKPLARLLQQREHTVLEAIIVQE